MRAATSEFGTSRHFATAQQFGRIWSEADINHTDGWPLPRSAEGSPGFVRVPRARIDQFNLTFLD
jgi:hypothetical protein